MKWKKLTIETTTQAVDFISDLLAELGIEGMEIEDNVPLSEEDKEKMFIDILPELPEDDGTARIHCYLEMDQDLEDIAARIQAGLEDIRAFAEVGEGRISFGETEDKDWMNNWKEFFKPFRVDDSIVIKPTWEKLEDTRPGDLVVEIDPGTAFGTGAHETTKLCIAGLKKYLKPGDALLDVGCGSGILSIIGMKLGAGCAVGTDIDGNAVVTARENAKINHLAVCAPQGQAGCSDKVPGMAVGEGSQTERSDKTPSTVAGAGSQTERSDKTPGTAAGANGQAARAQGTVEFLTGNVIGDAAFAGQVGDGCYNVVAANILADVIIPLSATVKRHMAPGAYFISSGIIDMKAGEVAEALAGNGFEIVEELRMKDWVCYVARVEGNAE